MKILFTHFTTKIFGMNYRSWVMGKEDSNLETNQIKVFALEKRVFYQLLFLKLKI